MKSRPPEYDLRELRQLSNQAALWVTPSVRDTVEARLRLPVLPALGPLPPGVNTVIVVGGGTLIDEAKFWRTEKAPQIKLVAIPSIWGSGAEVSPIVVLNREEKKSIFTGEQYMPDAYCYFTELAESLSPLQVRCAIGDCWAHALEAFLSPLATDELRQELASLVIEMLETPFGVDPAWFKHSARACSAQADSSVGLVHGIAHVLECKLRAHDPVSDWGHAKLCSLFLFPVMHFNKDASAKWKNLMDQYGLPEDRILDVLANLFEINAYRATLAHLFEQWHLIIRDPCSRTNSTLVRPSSLSYFMEEQFL